MKKIAIITQIKEGQLAEVTVQLISYISSFNPEVIQLYCFGSLQTDAIVSSVPVDVIELSADLIADKISIQPLVDELTGFYVLGVKSIQVDNLLSLLAPALAFDLVTGVTHFTCSSNQLIVTKSLFSGKASMEIDAGDCHVLGLNRNFSGSATAGSMKNIGSRKSLVLGVSKRSNLVQLKPITGAISLPDAALVVGAGRGFKDPTNWKIVEDLAATLGAATACSKPVSDLNWRPHHEHVGQTGVKISPNLYIACGISGAVQHLAGVNGSRIIVVINSDPEAPFFKHADYGIVGDVNDILPRLTKKLKNA
jgi:electron transfer flavoprotein alpha subunit